MTTIYYNASISINLEEDNKATTLKKADEICKKLENEISSMPNIASFWVGDAWAYLNEEGEELGWNIG